MPVSLTTRERAHLKARAHKLEPTVFVGHHGVTPSVITEVDRALTAHELIKVKVLGDDRDATLKALTGKGIPQNSIREALNMVTASGSRFTVFALVDALTRISGRIRHAGERAEMDSRIGRLLALAV